MDQPESFRKLFTIDEARAVLPIIIPAVEELLGTFQEIRTEIEAAAGQSGLEPSSPDLAGHLKARGVAPRLFERVKGLVERIHEHGCVVNGPEAGLIDFPCLFNSEIVFLCWKFGEPTIGHWHRIPDGFAGRRPLLDAGEGDAGVPIH